MLCSINDNERKISVCEDNNSNVLGSVIKRLYMNRPIVNGPLFGSRKQMLNGEIGIPKLVDEILGRSYRVKH